MKKLTILAIFLFGIIGIFNYAYADGWPPPTGNDNNNGGWDCGCLGTIPGGYQIISNRPTGGTMPGGYTIVGNTPGGGTVPGGYTIVGNTPGGGTVPGGYGPVSYSATGGTIPGQYTYTTPTQGGGTVPSTVNPTTQTASVANSVPSPALPSTGGGGKALMAAKKQDQSGDANILADIDSFLSGTIQKIFG